MEQSAFIKELVARGVMPPRPHRFTPPVELTWRHCLLARLMIHGCADQGVLAFIKRRRHEKVAGKTVWRDAPPPEPCEPLPVDEAAALAGVRRRFARQLVGTDIFKAVLRRERRALGSRTGADREADDDE